MRRDESGAEGNGERAQEDRARWKGRQIDRKSKMKDYIENDR